MAKKRGGGQSKASNRPPMGNHQPVSLRAEVSGLKPAAKGGGNTNPKSMLKLEHLQNVAVWSGGEGSVPSLGAFFGRRLAAVSESLAVPPDPSFLSCQRCETILQPGFNCTVRIEKNITKPRRRQGKKPNTAPKNNVVYSCNFCSHKNLKRGTPKSHIKDINPKPNSKKSKTEKKFILEMHTNPGTGTETTNVVAVKTEVNNPAAMEAEVLPLGSPSTPLVRTLLDMKKRKRNKSVSKRPMEPGSPLIKDNSEASGGASSKKRRKSWMSLKEIAEANEQSRNIDKLMIPFFT